MLSLKLAYRNLIGAGLRTWLNVFVLSFTYILIIWHYGIIDGWNYQAKKDMKAWETGNGQYWHQNYDPYDYFTIEDSHGKIPDVLKNEKEFLIYLAGHFDILRKEIRRIRRKNKDKLKIITTKDKWGRVRTQIKWQ